MEGNSPKSPVLPKSGRTGEPVASNVGQAGSSLGAIAGRMNGWGEFAFIRRGFSST